MANALQDFIKWGSTFFGGGSWQVNSQKLGSRGQLAWKPCKSRVQDELPTAPAQAALLAGADRRPAQTAAEAFLQQLRAQRVFPLRASVALQTFLPG